MNKKEEIFLINSIYRATEGEGVLIGYSQIFIRFQGCHIGCANCDSLDTWEFNKNSQISFEDLLQQVEEILKTYPIKRLSITGGDPLHPMFDSALHRIVDHYKNLGFFINVEASGLRVVPSIFSKVDFISFDYKTPSTQVKGKIDLVCEMAKSFPGKFQIKSVVQNLEDFHNVVEAFKKCQSLLSPSEMVFPWVITPSYSPGEKFPESRFLEIFEANDLDGGLFRVIGQQHKFIHGPDKKNV